MFVESFNDDMDSTQDSFELLNRSGEFLILDKIIKKIKKTNRHEINQNVSKLVDFHSKTMVIAKRVYRGKTTTNLAAPTNALRKNIESLMSAISIEDLEVSNRRKISIFRKELIRYNKKKFTYWYVVNNE